MSTASVTHGLDGQLVNPDWAPLAMNEVCELMKRFPNCGRPTEIVSVSPRPFSAAGVVATENGRIFIKRHHRSVRNREGLLEEHHFLRHLHQRGAAVPRVFSTPAGETAMEIEEWTFEVHEALAGVDLYESSLSWTPFHTPAHAHAAGQALARLHSASEGYDAPPRKPRPLVAGFTILAASHPVPQLHHYLDARPALAESAAVRANAEEALEILRPFHRELQPFIAALPPLWTHNDLHASNLLWSNASPAATATAVIDFGLAAKTNAVHDLAHAIERNIVEWLVLVNDPLHPDKIPVHWDHLRALLDGYESIRPLSRSEAAALAPMTALCHVEFALSEADYFLGVLHSKERAAMAHDGWLVGHARWFSSPMGSRLLDTLRQWAVERATIGGVA